MLQAVTVPARRRSFVVVISDFIGTGDWQRPLIRLAHRHDVVALRVVDAGDDALPEVGLLVVEDAETGEQLIVDASDPLLRAGLSGAAAERDTAIATVLREAAVPLHRIGTDQDLVQARPAGGLDRTATVMDFTSPGLLLVGAVVVAGLAVAAVRMARRRSEALAAAGVSRLPARARVPTGQWLSLGGLAVLAAAVGGPTATVPTPRAAGTVIIAVDVSQSMTATDVAPIRLAAATGCRHPSRRPAAVQRRHRRGRVPVRCAERRETERRPRGHQRRHRPTDGVRRHLDRGRHPDRAVRAIVGKAVALPAPGAPAPDLGYWGSATIVLFSDGQDGGDPDRTQAAAALAQNAGVHVETVGIGTVQGTTVQSGGYTLRTALDKDTLTAIAVTTGGSYHDAADASQLDDVGASIDRRLTVKDEPLPLAGGFAAAAAVLLALGAGLTVLRVGRLI